MRYSENLSLKLPEKSDHANIEDITENFEAIDASLGRSINDVIELSSSDGITYSAEVPGITELFRGLRFMATPEIGSASKTVKLNVNGFGDMAVVIRGSANTGETCEPLTADWLSGGAPIELTYNGSVFVAEFCKISAGDVDGVLPVSKGGHGGKTAADARSNLGITPANIGAQPTVTGAASTVTAANVTASRVLVSNTNGKISASSITTTELGRLSGIKSSVQGQLDEKAEGEHKHTAADIDSGIIPLGRGGTGLQNVTAGSFLVGAGADAMEEKTAAEVLSLIGASQVQLKSYVGTGNYGKNYPCSITFDFAPLIALWLGYYTGGSMSGISNNTIPIMVATELTTDYQEHKAFRGIGASGFITLGKRSPDMKTFTWYCTSNVDESSAACQLNTAGYTYYFLGIR